MGARDREGPGLGRAALVAWAACAVVVWNVVFDAGVIRTGREYLTRQALHQQGKGPAVTIRSVMDPGVRRAARTATASGAAVAAAGILVAWLAARQRARGRSAAGGSQ
jgi:ABC-type Fe3+ transport system permease subunit